MRPFIFKKQIENRLKTSALKDRFFIIAHLVQMNTILLLSKSLPMKIKGITTFTVVIYLKTNIIFRFILHALNVQNLTHIPGAYYTSLTARNAITFYFQHVPRAVLREVYRNYFLDFVMFNYTISEFVEGEISR